MQRSDKRKMSLPMKILLWVVGILFLLAIIAVIYVSAKIFITGDKIHNPLNRNHSELRSGKVNLKMGSIYYCTFGVDSDEKQSNKAVGTK